VCYSEEGQLSVGYKSGGEDMEIMMTMMMMMIFVLVDDGYVDDIKML